MKYSIEIGKIVEGALKRDIIKVHSYTEQLIKKLEMDNETIAANKFKKILTETSITTLSPVGLGVKSLPVDAESRTPLVDVIYPENNKTITVLTKTNQFQLDEFLKNYQNSDKLKKAGIDISNTLLLYGPPGCGKTNTAFMIAKKLNLPIIITRLDGLISSYLGTTAKNIRQVFEFAEKFPCVLLLDEFDAIAKARDDSNELGELKRVVNSLLQNIDATNKDNLIIAATNHENLLDKAVWRRFGYKLKIDLPDFNAIKEMIKLFSNNYAQFNEHDLNQIAICFVGKSGSFIEETINKSLRNAILNNEKFTKEHIFNEILIFENLVDSTTEEKVRFFRSKNTDKKYFTLEAIGEILKLSKGHISNLLKGEENNE